MFCNLLEAYLLYSFSLSLFLEVMSDVLPGDCLPYGKSHYVVAVLSSGYTLRLAPSAWLPLLIIRPARAG